LLHVWQQRAADQILRMLKRFNHQAIPIAMVALPVSLIAEVTSQDSDIDRQFMIAM
jgi:hypothetical protein